MGLVRGEPKPSKAGNHQRRHRGNGAAILREMGEERESLTLHIDPTLTPENVHGGYSSGQECWDDMCARAAAGVPMTRTNKKTGKVTQYRRAVRSDAVIGWALIIKPGVDVTRDWSWERMRRFDNDAMEVLAQIEPKLFRSENVRMSVEHHDERGKHMHHAGECIDEQGRYCGSLIDQLLFQHLNEVFPKMMRMRGWDVDDLDITDYKRFPTDRAYARKRMARYEGQQLTTNEYVAKCEREQAIREQEAALEALRERAEAEEAVRREREREEAATRRRVEAEAALDAAQDRLRKTEARLTETSGAVETAEVELGRIRGAASRLRERAGRDVLAAEASAEAVSQAREESLVELAEVNDARAVAEAELERLREESEDEEARLEAARQRLADAEAARDVAVEAGRRAEVAAEEAEERERSAVEGARRVDADVSERLRGVSSLEYRLNMAARNLVSTYREEVSSLRESMTMTLSRALDSISPAKVSQRVCDMVVCWCRNHGDEQSARVVENLRDTAFAEVGRRDILGAREAFDAVRTMATSPGRLDDAWDDALRRADATIASERTDAAMGGPAGDAHDTFERD
jgi:hypothetical protein